MSLTDALAEVLAVEEVAERGDTLFHLVHARPLHVARHGEHPGPGRGLGAVPAVGGGPVLEDPRQVGQRLDVVHDGRLAVQANGRREVGGLQAGHSPVALEALDEGRLLADDVGAGTPVEDHVDREVGTQYLPPHVAGGIGLVQGGGDPLLGEGHLTPHVQEALRKA